MIVAEQKPVDEIQRMVAPYEKILILGCGTCVTVCGAGGEREVSFLHEALQLAEANNGGSSHIFSEHTLKRQCDEEFLALIAGQVKEYDAVLSLGCGIGVQSLAGYFSDTVVLPGVNTSFLGMTKEWGIWDERCTACGDCRLEETAGICPITRCTKGILNGPCAGTKNGKCEVNADMDCGWILIYKRLERLGQLDKMRRYYPPRNFCPIPRPRRIMTNPNLVMVGGNNG
ncbi:MAG: methylenetetrahydrofolate reductase C-terminal domain-containing protein [Chloroflexota bacterium]|nr:methylenetetrahydrofolate reductase C-terminal domain-containing protein [Chloroflexota bacterium]